VIGDDSVLIAGARVVVLSSSRDTLRRTTTDAQGVFAHDALDAGAYVLVTFYPAGRKALAARDSIRPVQLAAGQTVTESFVAAAVRSVTDTVPGGTTETLAVASGTTARVAPPVGVPAAAVTLQEISTPTLPAGFSPTGTSVRLTYRPGATPDPRDTRASRVDMSFPDRGGANAGVFLQAYDDAGNLLFARRVTDGASRIVAAGSAAVVPLVLTPPATEPSVWVMTQVARASACAPATPSLTEYPTTPQATGNWRALILLHGLRSDVQDDCDFAGYSPEVTTFGALLPVLAGEPGVRTAYRIFVYKYHSIHGVAAAATGLATVLSAQGLTGRRTVLLAHSMGGLVARKYEGSGAAAGSDIERIVTLATPHLGTPLATYQSQATAPRVASCYVDPTRTAGLRWGWGVVLGYIAWTNTNFQASRDLDGSASGGLSTLNLPPLSGKTIVLGGARDMSLYGASTITERSTLALGGCMLEELGGIAPGQHDGAVPATSALPRGRVGHPTDREFSHHHIEMTGNGVATGTALFTVIKALLTPGTITVTSNLATTWTLQPVGVSGSGINGTASLLANTQGTAISIAAAAQPGHTFVVTSSDGPGTSLLLRPGEAKSFTLTYTPTAAARVSLGATPASVSPGQPSILTWSGAQLTSCSAPWTTNTGASGSQVVTPGATTTYTIVCQANGGGTVSASTTVVVVSLGSTAVRSIGAGYGHSCAVRVDNTAFCWGDNTLGALGQNFLNVPFSSTPLAVTGAPRMQHVDGGFYGSCGLDMSGVVWCWGRNSALTDPASLTAVRLGNSPVLATLQFGISATCGLGVPGDIWCWGTLSFPLSATPSQIAAPAPMSTISVNLASICAVDRSGGAYCWGDNQYGVFGNGRTVGTSLFPLPVPGGLVFADIAAGGTHSCGVTTARAAYCWGTQTRGQLGTGDNRLQYLTPTAVSGTQQFARIVAGLEHVCALTAAGQAWCWGDNTYGQLGTGIGGDQWAPAAVAGGTTFSNLTAGSYHTCGIALSDGSAWCWGDNTRGALGDGTTSAHLTPVRVRIP
jgi:alpha-tubulin suppressor-like RCC1 family protein